MANRTFTSNERVRLLHTGLAARICDTRLERRRGCRAGDRRHSRGVRRVGWLRKLDSLIKIRASIVVVWQLTGTVTDRERTAMRLIGAAFMLLAVYVAAQAVYVLLREDLPAASIEGIAWTTITCAVMLGLAYGKARVGGALDNPVLRTEGRVTLVDAYLAGAVLAGLVLNALLGWWWADPLAGVIIVVYGLKEGWAALHHH